MPEPSWYASGMTPVFAALVAGSLLCAPARAMEPEVGPVEVFAPGVAGPEGLAFTRDGGLVVGTTAGRLVRYAPDGSSAELAFIGDTLAGVTELRDRRVVATTFVAPGRVYQVATDGAVSVLAEGIGGPNFVVQTKKRRRVLVSASNEGRIYDVTDGTPVEVASGLGFANGMAIGKERRQRWLYVADTFGSRVWRLPLSRDDVLGAPEEYATGVTFTDGIALDRRGNLLSVGGDQLIVVLAGSREVRTLSMDPLLDWPSNLAFGTRRFGRRTLYMVNFGLPLGSGSTVVRMPYSIRGAKLIR